MADRDKEIELLKGEIRRLREEIARLTPPLETLLKIRRYYVYKRKPAEMPLLPEDRFIDKYYNLLGHYSFRLFIRDVIKFQDAFSVEDVTRYTAGDVTKHYISILKEMRLVESSGGLYRLVKRPVRSFGPTLEWFVSGIFEREFMTEALWGLRFKRRNVGGDYDVIAKLNGGIIYIEVKSSPPKQVYQSEISAFYNRVEDLSPEIAIFFMDTELRMKDKIVLMFEEELDHRGLNPEVIRMEKELFHISNRIFIINAKGGIENNIEKVIRWHLLYNK
ncbi:MAG TPA: hypothetical protein ENH38_04635 [Nitrospirae bacterium]|nr:hypothetical protein [Nitrospirota bacterium]